MREPPRRREESGSTTKSLNRFAPPSATEHGLSVAAIAVPPSVHACPSLLLAPSLSASPSLRPFRPAGLSRARRVSLSVLLSFSLLPFLRAFSRSLPLSLSPRDSLCHFGLRRFHGQFVSDSCPRPTRLRACLSRRTLDTGGTTRQCTRDSVHACVHAYVRASTRVGYTRAAEPLRAFRALTVVCLSPDIITGAKVRVFILVSSPPQDLESRGCRDYHCIVTAAAAASAVTV